MKFANISIERGYANPNARVGKDKTRKINIGDYAQILAIDNLYKQMGIKPQEIVYIEYYDLFDYDGEYVVLPVNFIFFNAFYGEKNLVLSPKIIPIFLGIHIINGNFNEAEWDYFKKYAPVGCRDEGTLSVFRSKGIEAYLQGCITVTFPKRNKGNYDKIYFVDVPQSLEEFIPDGIAKNAVRLSHEIYGDIERWLKDEECASIKEYMEKRFSLYKNTASLVVTSRLHCAAPCMAMGIPVIFACEEYSVSYAWMESVMPVYVNNTFKNINWCPTEAAYEDMKERITQLAIKRVTDTFEKYNDMFAVSSFFEQGISDKHNNAYTWRLEKFGRKHWLREQEIKYIVWGMTQITDEICSYMDAAYPNSRLMAVIDDYRDISYRGLQSIKSDKIKDYPECYFIGTGNSSSSAAQILFAELGWEDRLCTVFGTNYERN